MPTGGGARGCRQHGHGRLGRPWEAAARPWVAAGGGVRGRRRGHERRRLLSWLAGGGIRGRRRRRDHERRRLLSWRAGVVVVTVAGGVVVVAGTATTVAADVFFIFLENCLPSVSFGTRQTTLLPMSECRVRHTEKPLPCAYRALAHSKAAVSRSARP